MEGAGQPLPGYGLEGAPSGLLHLDQTCTKKEKPNNPAAGEERSGANKALGKLINWLGLKECMVKAERLTLVVMVTEIHLQSHLQSHLKSPGLGNLVPGPENCD